MTKTLEPVKTLDDVVLEERVKRFASDPNSRKLFDSINNIDNRFCQILQCINNEWKQILLAYCLDSKPQTRVEIMQKFRKIMQSDSFLIPMNRTAFKDYWGAFISCGFVEREKIGKRITYHLTQSGKEYAVPVALFVMEYAVKHKQSFDVLLGKTNSNPHTFSWPYYRAQAYLTLSENPSEFTTVAKLARRLSINRTRVNNHAKVLKKEGLVKLSLIGSNKKKYFHCKNTERAEENTTLRKKILNLLSSAERKMQFCEIASTLQYNNECHLSDILSDLVRNEEINCNWNLHEKSKIKMIVGKYLSTYEMLKKIKYSSCNRNILNEMKEIKRDDGKARAAAKLYYPHSQAYVKWKLKRIKLIDYLSRHPATWAGICKEITIKPVDITHALYEGIIKGERKNGEVVYTLNRQKKFTSNSAAEHHHLPEHDSGPESGCQTWRFCPRL